MTAAALPPRMVVLSVGEERFALPLEAVLEVVVPRGPFARVPRAAPAVRGAMNLRGRVVAVVELGPLLGLAASGLGPAQGHVLLLDGPGRGLGLQVAAVLGVERLSAGGDGAAPGALLQGVARSGGGPVTLLDPGALAAKADQAVHPE